MYNTPLLLEVVYTQTKKNTLTQADPHNSHIYTQRDTVQVPRRNIKFIMIHVHQNDKTREQHMHGVVGRPSVS